MEYNQQDPIEVLIESKGDYVASLDQNWEIDKVDSYVEGVEMLLQNLEDQVLTEHQQALSLSHIASDLMDYQHLVVGEHTPS